MEDNKIKNILNKKTIIIMCILIIAIICTLVFFRFYNSDINKFKRNLDDYNIDELKEVYTSTTSYDERKKIETIFEEKLNTILKQFTLNKKSYEETYDELEKYNDFSHLESKITKAKEQLIEIKTSKDNYAKGIVVEDGETGIILNVYIIVGYGVKISEVVYEVQKKVKYVLETTLDIDIEAVNVFVQSIRVTD